MRIDMGVVRRVAALVGLQIVMALPFIAVPARAAAPAVGTAPAVATAARAAAPAVATAARAAAPAVATAARAAAPVMATVFANETAPIEIVQLSPEEQELPPAALTPDQAASVLMEVAGRFEERGHLNAARLLYREVVDRYSDTIYSARAMERLNIIEGRPDFGGPETPVAAEPSPPSGGPGAPPGESPVETPPPSSQGAPAGRPRLQGGLDQSGRISVIVYSTVMSTWVALAIPISADAQGSAGYGLALLLGPPAGLVTSIYATRGRQVTAPQADVYVLAGNMGLWHGLAIGLIEDLEGREVAGATALGGLLGTATGALLISPGRTRETAASLSSLAAPYGAWFGLVLAQMLDKNSGGEDSGDTKLGAMLLGGDAALLAAVLTERDFTLSRDRGRLIALMGGAGALVGGAIDLLFHVEDNGPAWGVVGAGTVGGLVAGTALTADYDSKRGFTDPPRAEIPSSAASSGGDLAVLPLRPHPLPMAGAGSARWRESLRFIGASAAPSLGLTLLEARF